MDGPTLRDLDLLPVYTRNACPDLVGQFFTPCLQRAVAYDRATHNFSPEALSVAAAGLAGLINNGGRMRLVCQYDKLAPETVAAILAGHRDAAAALVASLHGQPLTAVDPADLAARHHLELLTWLVKVGRLDLKIAIPKNSGVNFHPKIGIITDAAGQRIAFIGSINESKPAWIANTEHLSVYRSWDDTNAYLQPYADEFETYWNNGDESSLILPLPEALRQQLIDFAPERNPAGPPLVKEPDGGYSATAARDELWAAIRYAVAHDPQTTLETAAAELWPHQLSFWRRHARDATEPPRLLIADEVGLGKTIQAGALLKTLDNRGQADRVLILTPAAARWQWQAELRRKFNLPLPVLERQGGQLRLIHKDDGMNVPAGNHLWRDAPRLIMSYDWLRRNRDQFLKDEMEYDLVIFDEAHHARYRDMNSNRRRPNSYLELLTRLAERTQGLLLLTATPMQIDPAELWALLNLLNPAGGWSEAEFRWFYDVNRPATLEEWDAARKTWLRNEPPGSLARPGALEQMAELARMPLSAVRDHLDYIHNSNPAVLQAMTTEQIRDSLALMRRTSAIKRSVSRHTRNLLRQYAREGKLTQTIPERQVQDLAIDLSDREKRLYDDIREFTREWYQGQKNMNPQALGFVMTHFRLRLGSSPYAFRQSLLKLRERRPERPQDLPQWEDLIEDDDFEYDPEGELPELTLTRAADRMLTDLLSRCPAADHPDSKFAAFTRQLDWLHSQGHRRIMVFSQFRDTQIWLRRRLSAAKGQYGVLAGLSGPEDWIYDPETGAFPAQARERIIAELRNQPAGILLCTETAAESLNFQFCSAVVNYDIPWNPMKLEQRIGRIDRIGQPSPTIQVINLFYKETAEYDAYQAMQERIAQFTEHVGALQPILHANMEQVIRKTAVEGADADVRALINDITPATGFDLDDLAAVAADETDPEPLLQRRHLAWLLDHPQWLPAGYEVENRGHHHWRVAAPEKTPRVATVERISHDYAAGSVEFFGPGSPLFPEMKPMAPAGGSPPQQQNRPVGEILDQAGHIQDNTEHYP